MHYSNLKPMERRTVEDRFRRREHALCIATSTLELGIDIGDVDCVLLFEPPDSVSSFLQRIGRSNRRQSSTHFWGICRGERAGEQLLRFLGLMQLARQGIVEAPLPNAFPSVLVQQVLSCLYEKKGISPASIRDLFPESSDTIDLVFPEMEKQGYLRRDRLIAKKFGSNHNGHPLGRTAFFAVAGGTGKLFWTEEYGATSPKRKNPMRLKCRVRPLPIFPGPSFVNSIRAIA